MNASLARTDSFVSVVSEDGSIASAASSEVKRTRKRFTNNQVMLLEQLFHETSHPTREQREKLSQKAELELRSVTVWFQNKRQTERKVALTNATNATQASSSATRPRTRVLSTSHIPSLDSVASRSEHRIQPQTPPRKRTLSSPSSALWESMPSSPSEAPPDSPEATRVIVEFGKSKVRRKRTLEWACAAASLADREGKRIDEEEEDNVGMVPDEGGDTEDESVHEAITPYSSFKEDPIQTGKNKGGRKGKAKAVGHDEETMNAALVLCGLRQ